MKDMGFKGGISKLLFLFLMFSVSVKKHNLFRRKNLAFMNKFCSISNCFSLQNLHFDTVLGRDIQHDSETPSFFSFEDFHHKVILFKFSALDKAFPPNFWKDPSTIELSKSSRNS